MKVIGKIDVETEKERNPFPRSSIPADWTSTSQVIRAAGNMALQRMLKTDSLQAKVRVGSSTDPMEREADLAADAVMRMPETQPRREPAEEVESSIQRIPASSTAEVTSAAQTRMDALRGAGRPLGPAEKGFFESRFGSDFSGVRLHSDAGAAELANLVQARAFTVGQDIFFGEGESPAFPANNERLLAHELTHVVQQGCAVPERRSGPGTLLQREVTPSSDPPAPQTIEPREQDTWRARVDAAIRAQFGLTGPGMTASRVRFLAPARFAARFPASEMEDLLLDMFLSPPMGSRFLDILRHHHMALAASGPTALRSLRRFITDRMRIGYFEYTLYAPPTPARINERGEPEPATPEVRAPMQITPGQLVAEVVAGVTSTGGPRAARRIAVRTAAGVETLVHEGCHFYVHSAFRDFANSARYRERLFGGMRMSSVLMEGFAEYFARQVMRANAADFGPSTLQAYDQEADLVYRFVTTMGEAQARQAYFQGNAGALLQLESAIELNVGAYPLMVPDFMLTAPTP